MHNYVLFNAYHIARHYRFGYPLFAPAVSMSFLSTQTLKVSLKLFKKPPRIQATGEDFGKETRIKRNLKNLRCTRKKTKSKQKLHRWFTSVYSQRCRKSSKRFSRHILRSKLSHPHTPAHTHARSREKVVKNKPDLATPNRQANHRCHHCRRRRCCFSCFQTFTTHRRSISKQTRENTNTRALSKTSPPYKTSACLSKHGHVISCVVTYKLSLSLSLSLSPSLPLLLFLLPLKQRRRITLV